MAKITYMPTADDNDECVVAGIKFPAYQPVEVADHHSAIIAKLTENPWFTDGEVDGARLRAWSLSRSPEGSVAVVADASRVLAEASTKADETVAVAQKRADTIVSLAKAAAEVLISDAEKKVAEIFAAFQQHSHEIAADADKTAAEIAVVHEQGETTH